MPPQRNKKSKASRFPVARIKKIMQLDEEVGKLASATPVMISKSLECFLQALLDEAAKETRARGSRKLTASHLKQTINTLPTFDFLREIVSNIPDPVMGAAPNSTPSGGVGQGPTKRKSSLNTGEPKQRRSRKPKAGVGVGVGVKGEDEEEEVGDGDEEDENPSEPKGLPRIGTWKKDMDGGGGTGEGGRGMFDDYEEDEDDY